MGEHAELSRRGAKGLHDQPFRSEMEAAFSPGLPVYNGKRRLPDRASQLLKRVERLKKKKRNVS